MDFTNNYSFRLPQRRGETPDRADIEDLTANWTSIDGLLKAATDSGATAGEDLAAHIADKNNPHNVTLDQIGGVSAEQVADMVAVYQEHIENFENPHRTTAEQVGAYSNTETNDLLADKVTKIGDLTADRVLITDTDGTGATVAVITAGELESLSGITGNIQEQLNNISFYNYLPSLPLITLTSGGDDFPDQTEIDAQVIPLIEAEYPDPAHNDAIIQNVQTQNTTQRKAILYSYFDGTQSDGYVGWRYVTGIDTVINRADGTVYGVVRSSEDIDFVAGEGTVNHATEADMAEAANGLVTIDLPSGSDIHTLYDVEHNAVYRMGPGNDIANKPPGADSGILFSQRASAGHTLHVFYAVDSGEFSSLWTEEWNGSTWSDWRSPIGDLASTIVPIEVTNLRSNPNSWGFPGGITNGNTFPFYFSSSAIGLPSKWGNASGSGLFVRQNAAGDGFVTLTRSADAATGNPVEFAFDTWSDGGFFFTQYRVFGADLGSENEPFQQAYISSRLNFMADSSSQDVGTFITVNGITNTVNNPTNAFTFGSERYSTRETVNFQLLNTANTQAIVNSNSINKLSIGANTDVHKFKNAYFSGDVSADTSFTLNGVTITEWPGGGSGSGKKYSTVVVGTADSGHTADDVDFLVPAGDVNAQNTINAAISALPATGGEVVILEGNYQLGLSGTISINSLSGVTVRGMGKATVLRSGTSTSQMYYINESTDCCIKDMRLETPTTNKRRLIYIANSVRTTIDRISSAEGSTGITVFGASCDNTQITNCNMSNVTGEAISITSATNTRVYNCTIRGYTTRAINVSGLTTINTLIANNIIDSGDSTSNSSAAVSLSSCVSCIVSNNMCSNGGIGIRLFGSCSGNTVTGNRCLGNGSSGILIDNSASENTVVGNSLFGNPEALVPGTGTTNLIMANGGYATAITASQVLIDESI